MTELISLGVGVGIGAVIGFLVAVAAVRRSARPSTSTPLAPTPDTTSLQKLNDLKVRMTDLQGVQRTTVQKLDHGFEHLQRELVNVANHLRTARADGVQQSRPTAPRAQPTQQIVGVAAMAPTREVAQAPAAVTAPRYEAPQGSAEAAAPGPSQTSELPLASLVTRWNNIEWPDGSSEGLRSLALALRNDWKISDALKHSYFLVYRDPPVTNGEAMYLFPFLGKNVTLFARDFFDAPASGAAEELVSAAEVCFREQNTTIEQELAKLMHEAYGVTDVLVISKKGQIA